MPGLTSIVSKADLSLFDSVYEEMVDNFVSFDTTHQVIGHRDTTPYLDYIKKLVDYNANGGKRQRGLTVLAALRNFARDPSEEDVHLACVLGWCSEIMQASYLVADDIMDSGENRRGRPCWYKLPSVGLNAVNDAFLLEHIVYDILKLYFGDKPYHDTLVDHFRTAALTTIKGQWMDNQTCVIEDFSERYSIQRYLILVDTKTSFYTVFSPILQGLLLARRQDEGELLQIIKPIADALGHLFQVQNDFLDCFGNEDEKAGTDIQEGKCCWPVVTALEKIGDDPGQLEKLQRNYGRKHKDNVEMVKALYEDLDLVSEYKMYEKKTF